MPRLSEVDPNGYTTDTDPTIAHEKPRLRGHYTMVHDWLLDIPCLSREAKLLYILLLRYAGRDTACFPAQETLAADLNAGDRAVRNWLAELTTAGLVNVTHRGIGRSNVYTLVDVTDELLDTLNVPSAPGAALTGTSVPPNNPSPEPTFRPDRNVGSAQTGTYVPTKYPHSKEPQRSNPYLVRPSDVATLQSLGDVGGASPPAAPPIPPGAIARNRDWGAQFIADCASALGWKTCTTSTRTKILAIARPLLGSCSDEERQRCVDWLFSNGYFQANQHRFITALKEELNLWINLGMPVSKPSPNPLPGRGNATAHGDHRDHRNDWRRSGAAAKADHEAWLQQYNGCRLCLRTHGEHDIGCPNLPPGAEGTDVFGHWPQPEQEEPRWSPSGAQ